MRMLSLIVFFLLLSISQYASVEYQYPCEALEDNPSVYVRDIKALNSSIQLYELQARVESSHGFSVASFKPDEIEVYYDDAECNNVIGYHAHNGEEDNNDVRIQQGTEYNFSIWESNGFSRSSKVMYNVERRASSRTNMDWTYWGKVFYTNPNFNAIVNESVARGGDPLMPDIQTTIVRSPQASIQVGTSDSRCQYSFVRPGNDEGEPIGKSLTATVKGESSGSACEITVNASDGSVYTAQINVSDFETTETNDRAFDPPIEAKLFFKGNHIGFFVYGVDKYTLLDLDRNQFR